MRAGPGLHAPDPARPARSLHNRPRSRSAGRPAATSNRAMVTSWAAKLCGWMQVAMRSCGIGARGCAVIPAADSGHGTVRAPVAGCVAAKAASTAWGRGARLAPARQARLTDRGVPPSEDELVRRSRRTGSLDSGYVPYIVTTRSPRDFFAFAPMNPNDAERTRSKRPGGRGTEDRPPVDLRALDRVVSNSAKRSRRAAAPQRVPPGKGPAGVLGLI